MSGNLYAFIQKYEAKHVFNPAILTDIDVNNGSLFYSNGTRRYDVLVVGFSEYVTSQEYYYYKRFVESGGNLILLNSCNFVAEVRYYPNANMISLVSGHGWNFNGTAAWSGPFSRWSIENSNWIGSDYKLFYTDGYLIDGASLVTDSSNAIAIALSHAYNSSTAFVNAYSGHEENVVTNSTDNIIMKWDLANWNNGSQVVAAYLHRYKLGFVIDTGIFASDIIAKNLEMQTFILIAMLSKPS